MPRKSAASLKQFEWQNRIKDVEQEFASTRLATNRLLAEAKRDATILQKAVSLRDIQQASCRLDGTYIIRLFAEFETGLRQYWPTARGTDPPTRTRDLLDGIAATRRIPRDQLNDAHEVRDYRNNLIHDREERSTPIPIAEARRRLCRFFSFLPLTW